MEQNNLTFAIERLFGPDKQFKGYFVTKSNEAATPSNPMAEMMKGVAEAMGEMAVPKPKDSGRLFCATPKEVNDYIVYELGEFTGH